MINLEKGQNILLKEDMFDLSEMTIGLGWEINTVRGKQDYDLDASAILLDENNRCSGIADVVYYGEKMHHSKAIWSCGDNLVGSNVGDAEQLVVKLRSVPMKYKKIVFVTNIYQAESRRQDFGQVKNAYVRAADAKGNEIAKFNLSENFVGKTAVVFAEIYRHETGWKFKAIGEPKMASTIQPLYECYK